VTGQFDRIVYIGMAEHVGYKNYKTYMKVVDRCLRPDGLFLLHTIGQHTSQTSNDPWIHKYIFPHSMAPSAKQIAKAAEGLFMIQDWQVFVTNYVNTITTRYENFTKNWDKLKDVYDERFYRMWTYYLFTGTGVARRGLVSPGQIRLRYGRLCFRSRESRVAITVYGNRVPPAGPRDAFPTETSPMSSARAITSPRPQTSLRPDRS